MAALDLPRATRWLLLGLTLALLAQAIVRLAGPVAMGRPDNCDFIRVLGPAGLRHEHAEGWAGCKDSFHFRRHFARLDEPEPLNAWAAWPTALVARTAAAVFFAVHDDDEPFDIAWLGVLQLVLCAAILLPAFRAAEPWRWWLATLFAAVITDPEVLIFFSSFYAEPTVQVLLLALVALVTLYRPRTATWLGAAACLLVLGFTRKPLAVAGVLAAVSLVLASLVQRRGWRRWPMPAIALCASLVPAAYWLAVPAMTSNPLVASQHQTNRFHAIFLGVVADVPDASERQRLLDRLGLPARLDRFSGAPIWGVLDDALRQPAWLEVSTGDVAWVYLSEPARLGWAAGVTGTALAGGTPDTLYESVHEAGQPRIAPAQAPRLSSLRRLVLEAGWWGLAPLLLGLLALAAWRLRAGGDDEAGPAVVLGFLVAMAVAQVVIAVLGEGRHELERHVHAARLSIDLALAVALVLGGRRLIRPRDRRPA
jgi:hypothetical protein